MDVSVSRLNNRLALQLPPELPLGLVFVIGQVENLQQPILKGEQLPTIFDLVETNHRLRCQLTLRSSSEVTLKPGDNVRAGGHLAFDRQRADYFLLARDIEVIEKAETAVPPTPVATTIELPEADSSKKPRTALTPILADIKKRSQATKIETAVLPDWVQRIAPPEVQTEMGTLSGNQESNKDKEPAPMSDNLLQTLTKAMESKSDVELTPDMIRKLAPNMPPQPTPPQTHPYDIPTQPPITNATRQAPPPQPTTLPAPPPQAETPATPASQLPIYLMWILILTAVIIIFLLIWNIYYT